MTVTRDEYDGALPDDLHAARAAASLVAVEASGKVSSRIPSEFVDAAALIAEARRRSGLTLRDLAARAGTSHSALSAYERGRKTPTTATLTRVVRAAGFSIDAELSRRVHGGGDVGDRGAELEEVLALAEEFPARHSPDPPEPVFGRRATSIAV